MSNQDFDPDAYLTAEKAPAAASAPPPGSGFNPDSYLAAPKPFDPDAYLKAQPSRLDEAAAMVTDIPGQTAKEFKAGIAAVSRGLNPFDETAKAEQAKYLKETAEAPWYDITPGIRHTITRGAEIAGAAPGAVQAGLSWLTGPAKSVIAHGFNAADPMSAEDHARIETMGLHPSTGEGVADQALAAIRPKGVPVTAPELAWNAKGEPNWGWRKPEPVPPNPPNGPLGVTLSEGQETGDLGAIRREQDALRNAAGENAYQHAQQFNEQQAGEIATAREQVASALDPDNRAGAETPQRAADILTDALAHVQRAREAGLESEADRLRPKAFTNPLDAADTVANSLRNSADTLAAERAQRISALQQQHEDIRAGLSPTNSVLAQNPLDAADIVSGAVSKAAEDAQAAKNAAYARANELPGAFHPAAFNKIGDEIRASVAAGEHPTFIDPQRTPLANAALDDLDNILSELKQTRDPDTGQVLKKPPNTPERVDVARQRLNSYLSNAIQSARSNPSGWMDVNAIRDVIDAFDDAVANRFAKGTFIGGDPQAVIDAFKEARKLNSEYRRNFTPQGPGDKVGAAIRDILGRYDGQAATPEQINNMLYGKGDAPVKIGRRLIDTFGADSPEIGAIKQGLFSYVFERPGQPADAMSAAKRFQDLASGPGRTLLQTYLSPSELNAWGQHADALRATVEPARISGDSVARELAKITGPQSATETQVADALFGRQGLGENANGTKLIQHIKDTYGETSPTFLAAKQGQLAKVMRTEEGAAGFDPKDIAGRIDEFLSGRGRPTADVLLNEKDRSLLSRYRDSLNEHAEQINSRESDVDRFVKKLVGGDGNAPVSMDDAVKAIFRRSASGDTTAFQLARALRNQFGENSAPWAAFKQGLFRHVVENGEGLRDFGPAKVSENLQKLLNTQLARETFSPQERSLLQAYSDLHKRLIVPQAGAQWSNNAAPLKEQMQQASGWLMRLLGTTVGGVIGGMFGGIGAKIGAEAAGYVAGDRAAAMLARSQQKRTLAQLQRQMPLVSEQWNNYNRALKTYNKAITPMSRAAVTLGAANLARSLEPFGIQLSKMPVQLPGLAPANEDKKTTARATGGRVSKDAVSASSRNSKKRDGDDEDVPRPPTDQPDSGAKEKLSAADQTTPALHDISEGNSHGMKDSTAPDHTQSQKRDGARTGGQGYVANKRIDRSAFLYLEDKSNKQCDQCCFFTPEHRCSVITGHPHVEPKWSCGVFVPGQYNGKPTGGEITLEEAGLVKRQVRCENCRFDDGGECGLYKMLNERLPDVFDLDTGIKPFACCNAQEPADEKVIERAKGGRVVASNIDPNPSQAQIEAGNYRKDKLHVAGLPITIENAKGSIRRGVDARGRAWTCRLPANYGYVRGTVSADFDHLDVYLGPHRNAPNVYVIDQIDAGL